MNYREELILGSACEAGEVYKAVIGDAQENELRRIINFYDYLEIQPITNNRFMIESDKYPNINSEEDLKKINKKIVGLAEKNNKLIVATCDAHFLDPEDGIYRKIIMKGKGYDDTDEHYTGRPGRIQKYGQDPSGNVFYGTLYFVRRPA
jgi:DNA polymerase-3 subunit alpha (Gram-positive type)